MSKPSETTDSNLDGKDQTYVFRLFVTGASSHSIRAIANIKHICEAHLAGRYTLEIIDVYQQREIAQSAQLIALPLLIKQFPWPERRLIGDLSDERKVLNVLGLTE